MGAAGSVQPNEVSSDSGCSPPYLSQSNTSNGLTEEEGATCEKTSDEYKEEITLKEELWLRQVQDLGKIIHNLASENLKLIDANKNLTEKCEEQESRWSAKISHEDETHKNLQIVENVQEETTIDKKLIEDLKQQIQTNLKNSAAEGEKYHENLNFMRLKVKEYEQVVEELEKDAVNQSDAIKSLQSSLLASHFQGKEAEKSITGMKETIEVLNRENKDYQIENNIIKEQLELERNIRRKLSDENLKLQEELQNIKQKMTSNSVKRASEDSDADFCDMYMNGATDQSPNANNTNKNEEAKTLSPRAAAELEVFQKQMEVKREARQKALSAISMEMERLRSELNKEREERRNAVKELENARCISDSHLIFEEVNDLKHKLTSEHLEKDRIYKEMIKTQKQANEEIENILKELEKEKAKTQYIMGENKFMKEQLEENDHMLQLRSEENNELQNKLDTDREKYQQQVLALKDVVSITKQMLTVRENQVTHLKQTLQDIEVSVIEKHRGSLTAGLRAEYETQMENIKALKGLYEERMKVMNVEKEKLINEQKEMQRLIEEEKMSVETLEAKLQEKEETITERNSTVSDLQDQLSEAIDQSRNLSYELTLINNMFTQILGSSDMDLDRLTKLLQENHDLITEITTKGDCNETTASLPKLLLDLVCNAENAENNTDIEGQECSNEESVNTINSVSDHTVRTGGSESAGYELKVSSNGNPLAMQDISSNLPKVWKVLLELVSHHVPSPAEESSEDSRTSCYKSVDTPYGPKNVISVSKTFLRLRDLILQKKSLQKEVTRLKQLNVHLETKLNDQERRLSLVSTDLRKTWGVVDHMRVQHQQLHTHEKVLRYELQQKRKLLMELKEELEYCREKWEEAREKNSQSESDWQKLRTEFALRKSKPQSNSGESGFSEEKDEDCSESVVTKIQSQRKPSNNGLNNSSHLDCVGPSLTKTEDTDTVMKSAVFLPDLVSVTADLPLPSSNVSVSGANSPSDIRDNNISDHISLLPNIVQDDSSILESAILEECSTVSLIALLKQQLSCFSKNLEIITTDVDTNDHFRALQSIFALPAIQIPDYLNSSSQEPSTSYSATNNSDNGTRASVDRGIQCNEYCHDNAEEEKPKICEKVSPELLVDKLPVLENCENSLENSLPVNNISESTNQDNCNSLMILQETVENGVNSCEPDPSISMEDIQRESRSERLQRVERQCQQLFDKVTRGSEARSSTSSPDQLKGQTTRNLEDMLNARAVRLKRLEEQSQQLFKKVSRTTYRSEELSNRLEELHEQYGNEGASGSAAVSNEVTHSEVTDLPSSKIPDTLSVSEDLKTELQTSDSFGITASLPVSSTSTHIPPLPPPPPPPLEEMLDARAARLKRLEEQSQQLFNKVTKTTHRSVALSNRLEKLHEQYGSEEIKENTINPTGVLTDPAPEEIPNPPPLPNHVPSNLTVLINASRSTENHQNSSPDPLPSTSIHIPATSTPPLSCPIEEMHDARMAGLKLLEEQSQQFLNNSKKTTHHNVKLSNKLDEQYCSKDSSETAVNTSVSNILDAPSLPGHHMSIKLPTTCLPSTSSHIPAPPPLPFSLPAIRLPTEMDNSRPQANFEQEGYEEEDKR